MRQDHNTLYEVSPRRTTKAEKDAQDHITKQDENQRRAASKRATANCTKCSGVGWETWRDSRGRPYAKRCDHMGTAQAQPQVQEIMDEELEEVPF